MTKFETFCDEVFKQAKEKGFVDYELFYASENGFSVRVFKGEIAEYKNSNTEGVGFRGTFNGKIGYASSEKLDVSVIPALLQNAMGVAEIIEDPDVEKLYPGDDKYPEVNCYNEALNSVEAAEKIEMAFNIEKHALSLDPRVKMADHCTVLTNETESAIANSYGLNVSQKRNMAAAYMLARVEENGESKSGIEIWRGRDFKDFDYKKVAGKAVEIALSNLGASSIPTGDYQIVFDNNKTTDMLGVFSSIFMAEQGQKGFSLLNKERLGEVIAKENITIRDDGVTDLCLNSRAFDAEGVATKNKAVIEKGVLKTLLYNTKAAAKDGVKSTGNASKAGFGGAITTSITNFYLEPGTTSHEDMIKGIEKGVLITDLAGLHSGVNPVSGDFSVSADGFLIEGGKVIRPVDQITVAGNFFEMLKNVEIVASDLKFNDSIGAPSILVNGLKVAGL